MGRNRHRDSHRNRKGSKGSLYALPFRKGDLGPNSIVKVFFGPGSASLRFDD